MLRCGVFAMEYINSKFFLIGCPTGCLQQQHLACVGGRNCACVTPDVTMIVGSIWLQWSVKCGATGSSSAWDDYAIRFDRNQGRL